MVREAYYNLNDHEVLNDFLKYSKNVFSKDSLFLIKFIRIYLSIAKPGIQDLNNLNSVIKKDKKLA